MYTNNINFVINTMYNLCIIGGGISGIAVAKFAVLNNIDFVILDKNKSLGGCWVSKTYPDVQLQNSKDGYQFKDMHYDKNVNEFPFKKDILKYLENYCLKYNLINKFKFNCLVNKVEKIGNIWNINYEMNGKNGIILAKNMCVCSGFYTSNYIPDIPGLSIYKGEFKHVQEFNKINDYDFKDKHVIIVGNGPSGADIANNAVNGNAKEVTLLYRTPRWFVKKNRLLQNLILNKYTFKLSNWTNSRLGYYMLVIIYSIVILAVSYYNNYNLRFPIPNNLPNKNNIVVSDHILNLMIKNKLNYIKANILKFDDNYIHVLVNNKIHKLKPDLIIFATGYNNNIKFMNLDTIPKLFKHIIHPDISNCGFIGFAATHNWLKTIELQAEWFINYIQNKFSLPNKELMLEYINKFEKSNIFDYNDLSKNYYNYHNLLKKELL